jgi:2-dehydro-3-deoxyphosphooctonate aldolase (KDO 8-P synthase)
LPILTDIHEAEQAPAAAAVVDVLQIPAFLSRQTDLLMAAGRTGLPVNVKKGQWMAAEAMTGALEKVRAGGSTDLAVTERGTFFGYGDLVVDLRNVPRLRAATGAPVIYDATHSVQQPGQASGGASGGLREYIPTLLAAAAAAGADGFFIETHPDPERAISDAATQWPLDRLEGLLARTLAVRDAVLERVDA